jgi:hypothetical protein
MACIRPGCIFIAHKNIHNNGGAHCCLACRNGLGHGPACKRIKHLDYNFPIETLIYTTDIPEYKTGPTKFGICMATFQRKNGKSPIYLKRSLEALINQTATNWHLYLVGDKYENDAEFQKCISFFPKDKITAVNLPSAPERENITNRHNLWMVAGCNAFNHSHKLAIDDGCDYILHHDDDDPFHIKKIQVLNYVLEKFQSPICIFHYSTHQDTSIIPRETIRSISINNLCPKPANVVHTALCIHSSIGAKFKYEGYTPGKKVYKCGDIQLIDYINKFQIQNPAKYSIFVPLLLCRHDIEGETII